MESFKVRNHSLVLIRCYLKTAWNQLSLSLVDILYECIHHMEFEPVCFFIFIEHDIRIIVYDQNYFSFGLSTPISL